MINKFLLNKILLSWGDEDGSKQTDSNIIKAGNIAAALSPYTIKCIYDELSKGVKIIDLSTIERNIKLHKIKATVPQMLNIYINGEKLDMNKDISRRGILLTSEFDNIQGKKEVTFSFKLNNERVLFALPSLFVNCVMLSEVTEFLDFDKLRELIIQYPGFETASRRRAKSSASGAALPSSTSMTSSARRMAARLRSTPRRSTVSAVSRMPAVSVRRRSCPPKRSFSSMVSRVVPGTAVTMARS